MHPAGGALPARGRRVRRAGRVPARIQIAASRRGLHTRYVPLRDPPAFPRCPDFPVRAEPSLPRLARFARQATQPAHASPLLVERFSPIPPPRNGAALRASPLVLSAQRRLARPDRGSRDATPAFRAPQQPLAPVASDDYQLQRFLTGASPRSLPAPRVLRPGAPVLAPKRRNARAPAPSRNQSGAGRGRKSWPAFRTRASPPPVVPAEKSGLRFDGPVIGRASLRGEAPVRVLPPAASRRAILASWT